MAAIPCTLGSVVDVVWSAFAHGRDFCSSYCVCYFSPLDFPCECENLCCPDCYLSTDWRGLLIVTMVSKCCWYEVLNYFQDFIYDQKSWCGSSGVKPKTLLDERIPF